MLRRHWPMQRLLAWIAFVAVGLAALAPVVSQVVLAPGHVMADMVDMADMPIDCIGHHAAGPMRAAFDGDAGHGGMPMDACGYCSFLAHHPGLPTVPVVLMRSPMSLAEAMPPAVPTRPRIAPPLFDAAPRGPPVLT